MKKQMIVVPNNLSKSKMVAALNEWMRIYIDEPERFEREFQTVAEFKQADDIGKVPTYGDTCASYLLKISADLARPKKAPKKSAKKRAV